MDKKEQKNSFISYFYGLIGAILLFLAAQGIAYVYSAKGLRILNYIVIFIFLIQWMGFVFASGLFGNSPTEKYYDITGSFTYITTLLICYVNLEKPSKRQIIVMLAALVWSLRLGFFLFIRIINNGGVDRRFTEIKKSFSDFLIAWSLQGVWVFLTLLSILTICQDKDPQNLNILNYFGIGVWIFGFLFEVIADHQKSEFRINPSKQGQFIQEGLWSLSRHPNYFGEICLWIGVSLICYFDGLNPFKLVVSPLFVAFLLIFVSGIPILEKHANEKFGSNEDYQKYKNRTPVLVPIIGRSGDAKF